MSGLTSRDGARFASDYLECNISNLITSLRSKYGAFVTCLIAVFYFPEFWVPSPMDIIACCREIYPPNGA